MCCCLPPCFYWLCFIPRALRTIGEPRSPEEIERQRKIREKCARRRRWWRCQRAPPDEAERSARDDETRGEAATRGGEIELGEIRVDSRDVAALLNDAATSPPDPADPRWHELIHANPAFDAPVAPWKTLPVVSEPPKTNKHHLYRRKDYILHRKESLKKEKAARKAAKEAARKAAKEAASQGGSGSAQVETQALELTPTQSQNDDSHGSTLRRVDTGNFDMNVLRSEIIRESELEIEQSTSTS